MTFMQPQVSEIIPDWKRGISWVIVGCVAAIGALSFGFSKVSDFALALLSVASIVFIIKGRTVSQPILFAVVWAIFVLFEAIYATSAGLPGRQFAYLGKHLPIALGPIIAFGISESCRHLRIQATTLVGIFLIAVTVGASAVLVQNEALDHISLGMLNVGAIGSLNRNYAAFCCGILIIAGLSVIQTATSSPLSMPLKVAVLISFCLVVLLSSVLLISLQSRTAYAATSLAIVVWIIAMALSSPKSSMAATMVIIAVVVGWGGFKIASYSDRIGVQGGISHNIAAARQAANGIAPSNGEARIELAYVAIGLIKDRPWLGWGVDVSRHIGQRSVSDEVKNLTQFHNGYLQFVVHFGIIGVLLMFALIAAIVRNCALKYGGFRKISHEFFSAALSLVAYLSVFNFTETILFVGPASAISAFISALACLDFGEPS